MNKRPYVVLLTLMSILFAQAGRITTEEALQESARILQKNDTRSRTSDNMTIQPYGDEIFVVNASDGGWVLVGNDDRLKHRVLAYSHKGHYKIESLPDNAKAQLEKYAREIAAIPQNAEEFLCVGTRSTSEIDPLLGSTEWGQGTPFNLLCPVMDGRRSVTGCVNTAISQIMYYHKYPARGNGEHSYEWNGTTLSVNFSESEYQWDEMLPQYESDYSEVSAQAVAKLMYDCGVANESSYSPAETGADLNEAGLVNYFGYDPSIYTVSRDKCTQDEYESLLRQELEAGRPVLYAGGSEHGAHAFVCDGYDGNGYFHFNFGWYGMSNGYYLTSATGYDSSPSFTGSILPYHGGTPGLWLGSDHDFIWDAEKNEIKCEFYGGIQSEEKVDAEVALALENTNTSDTRYYVTQKFQNTTGFGVYSMKLEDVVLDGNYIVYPVYSINGNRWQKVYFAQGYCNHVNLEVTDGVKSFSNPDFGGEMGEGIICVNGGYYRLQDDEAIFTKRNNRDNCYSGDVTIKDEIEVDGKHYRVVSVEKDTFEGSTVGTVTIGKFIREFPMGSFSGAKIKEIIFSDAGNLKEIGGWAFNGTNINKINLPKGVTTLGYCAFQSCGAEEIHFPATINNIGEVAFNYCTDLKDLYVAWQIKEDLPKCGRDPFQGCDLETITLHVPVGCSEIYRNATVWKDFANIVDDVKYIEEPITILAESLTLSPDAWKGEEGSTFTITATVAPENTTDKTLTWESSDETVATVDAEGNVTVLKEGTCVITARTLDGSELTAQCVVTGLAGIDLIFADPEANVDVYNMQGILLKRRCTLEDLYRLQPAMYLLRPANGKSFIFVKHDN